MQYRDYEIYTNNPTLNTEDQSFYDRDPTIPIGFITTLPPTAMFIINRARAFDRRRNALLAIHDKNSRIRKGYENIKDRKAFAMAEEVETSDRVRDIIREVQELKAMNSDPGADQNAIKLKIDMLMNKQAELAKDVYMDKSAIYASSNQGAAAKTRDILRDTADHEWSRIAAGESNEETLERLERTVVMMEQRNIVSKVNTQLTPKSLTTAGRKFYDKLSQELDQIVGGDGYEIEVGSNRVGLYDYKIKFKKKLGAYITNGSTITVSSHQLLTEHKFIHSGKTFDFSLTDAFESYDKSMRRFVLPMVTEGKQNVIKLHTDVMFGERGSGTNFIHFLGRSLRDQSRFKSATEMMFKIATQDKQYVEAIETSVSVGKGNVSNLNLTQMFVQQQRPELDERTKGRKKAGRVDNRFKVGDSEFDIQNKYMQKIIDSEGPVYVSRMNPVTGVYEVLDTGHYISPHYSSASGFPQGTFQIIRPEELTEGGSIYGQTALRSNITTGASMGFLYNKSLEAKYRRIASGKRKRISARKKGLSIRNSDRSRLDIFSAKRLSKIQSELQNDGDVRRTAAFRTEETVLVLGSHEEDLWVSQDQAIRIVRNGEGSIADLLKNPNISIQEIHESITELHDHNVVFNPNGTNNLPELGYYSTHGGKSDKTNSVHVKRIMGKIDTAISEGKAHIVITKEDAKILGVTVDSRREFNPTGVPQAKKTYAVFFEEARMRKGIDSNIRHFRFFDSSNSLIDSENNKINLKQTYTPMTQEKLIEHSTKMNAEAPTLNELQRRISAGSVVNLIGKGMLVEKHYDMHMTEGSFRKILTELIKDELDGINEVAEHGKYGHFRTTVINDGKERVFQFGVRGKGDTNLINTANKLFETMALGKIEKDNNYSRTPRYIKDIIVTKNANGKVIKVGFSYNEKVLRNFDFAQLDTTIAKAVTARKGESFRSSKEMYNTLRSIEESFNHLFTKYKAGGSKGFLVSSGDVKSATGRYIQSVIVGENHNSEFIPKLAHIISGFGTPEGHQTFEALSVPQLGSYNLMSGPKLNVYDVRSVDLMNKEMGKYLRAIQASSYERNTQDATLAAELNRAFNLTAMKNATVSNQAYKKKIKQAITKVGLKDITWRRTADVLELTENGDLGNRFHRVQNNVDDILNIVKKAKSIGASDIEKYLESELGFDGDMVMDSRDAIEKLAYFEKENKSILSEVFGNHDLKVKGIDLNWSVPIHTITTGKGPVTSDFLAYRAIDQSNLPKLSIEDLLKNIDNLPHDTKNAIIAAKSRQLKSADSAINHMVKLDDYAAHVIRLNAANENMKLLMDAEKSGNVVDREHLAIAINSTKRIMERSVNFIDEYLAGKGFGKGAIEKITTQFSIGGSIEKSNLFIESFGDMDWRTAVISREKAAGMAKSAFILGSRARDGIVAHELSSFINSINKKRLDTFIGKLDHTGTHYEGIINDMFADVEEISSPNVENRKSVSQAVQSRFKATSKKLRNLRKFLNNEPDAPKLDVDSIKKYRTINQIRNVFSEEGFYKKIETQMKSSGVSKHTLTLWNDINGILESNKLTHNRKTIDSGRLWAGWTSLGERLSNTTQLTELRKEVMNSFEKTDKAGRAKAQKLLSFLDSLSSQFTKANISGQIDAPGYAAEFGKVADLMMTIDSIGAGGSTKQLLKGKIGKNSQLSARIVSLEKKAQQAAASFMDFELLLRQYDGMTSFNSDSQVLRLMQPGMTNEEIEKLAESKSARLVATATKMQTALEAEGPEGQRMAEKVATFLKVLNHTDKESGFQYELSKAMKFMRDVGTVGVTSTGKVDPDIMQKHINGMTLRMVLETQIKNLPNATAASKQSMLASIRNGKIKFGDVLSHIMDRDFDGDSINIYANIIDKRWGVSDGKLSSSNVAFMMKNMSFVKNGNEFIPTNSSSALISDLLFNDSKGAHTVVMETAYEAAVRRLNKESDAAGKAKGFNFDKALSEVIDDFVESNHGKKSMTDSQKMELMHKTYVIKNVERGLTESSERYIKVGDKRYKVDGGKMSLDHYSRKVNSEFNILGLGTDKLELERTEAMAKNIQIEGMEFLSKHITDQKSIERAERKYAAYSKLELMDSGKFSTQKIATGRLYKYPTLLRMLADSMNQSASDEVRKVSEMFGTVATMAGYTFQQKIAIGMKKGGIDAVEGVDNLFKDIMTITNISDDKEREKAVKGLHERVTKQGLTIRVDGSDKATMIESGYFEFKGMQPRTDIKMHSVDALKFGIAKQKAIDSLIDSAKRDEFDAYMRETYKGQAGDVQKLADGIVSSVQRRSELLREKTNLSSKDMLIGMSKRQLQTNADVAKINATTIRLTETALHGIVSLHAHANASTELQDLKGFMKLVGTEEKFSSESVMITEHLRNMRAKATSMGISSTLVNNFLSYMETPKTSQGTAMMDLFRTGPNGSKVTFAIGEKPKPQLIGKNFGVKAAGIGLGILALGAFAPSASVGKNSNSVVDKTDEYSAMLPDKMIAQYNNQASVAQINPWVSNRLKQERAESARFNQMFYKTFVG